MKFLFVKSSKNWWSMAYTVCHVPIRNKVINLLGVVRRCWVKFQCRGVLLIWILVGQGPVALAVGADGGWSNIISLVYFFSLFSGIWPDID